MIIGNENILRAALVEEHLTFSGADGLLTLTEKENIKKSEKSVLRQALIHNVVPGSLLIGFHESAPVPNLVKEIDDYHRKCDYALFTRINGSPVVFFIELKSLSIEEEKVIHQLTGGACIADYLRGFITRFLNIPQEKYEERYVVFYRSRAAMKLPPRTRLPFSGRQRNTTPDTPMALPDPDTRQYSVSDLIRN